VVIAIIAILAAMLLPSLAKARGTAQDLTCKSNLRQVSTGVILYLDDGDRWYPTMRDNHSGQPYKQMFDFFLDPYVPFSEGIYWCPSATQQVSNDADMWGTGKLSQYARWTYGAVPYGGGANYDPTNLWDNYQMRFRDDRAEVFQINTDSTLNMDRGLFGGPNTKTNINNPFIVETNGRNGALAYLGGGAGRADWRLFHGDSLLQFRGSRFNYISVGLSVVQADMSKVGAATFINRFTGVDGTGEWGRVTGSDAGNLAREFPYSTSRTFSAGLAGN
jgi:hypothetical protein